MAETAVVFPAGHYRQRFGRGSIPVSHDQQQTVSNGAFGAFFTVNFIFYIETPCYAIRLLQSDCSNL